MRTPRMVKKPSRRNLKGRKKAIEFLATEIQKTQDQHPFPAILSKVHKKNLESIEDNPSGYAQPGKLIDGERLPSVYQSVQILQNLQLWGTADQRRAASTILQNLFRYDLLSVKNFNPLMPHIFVAKINRYREIIEKHKTKKETYDYEAALVEMGKILHKEIKLKDLEDSNINRAPSTVAVSIYCIEHRPYAPRFRDAMKLYYEWNKKIAMSQPQASTFHVVNGRAVPIIEVDPNNPPMRNLELGFKIEFPIPKNIMDIPFQESKPINKKHPTKKAKP